MGELIAVLSGKGGTGKTSVCAGLSTTLARMGHKVLAIDCDMGLQNLDISLGLTDYCALTFADIYSGAYSLASATHSPMDSSIMALGSEEVTARTSFPTFSG